MKKTYFGGIFSWKIWSVRCLHLPVIEIPKKFKPRSDDKTFSFLEELLKQLLFIANK